MVPPEVDDSGTDSKNGATVTVQSKPHQEADVDN